ncbi:MAG: hypothetical protein ACE5GN_02445 [Waddliaceae bacterium]
MDTIKPYKVTLTVLCCSLALVGCVAFSLTRISAFLPPIEEHKIGKTPELGLISKAHVGDAIYTEFDYKEVQREGGRHSEWARLTQGYKDSFVLGRINIAPGDLLAGYRDQNGLKQYCSTNRTYFDLLVGPYDISCFSDSSGDGSFDKVRVPRLGLGSWKDIGGIPFKVEVTRERVGAPAGQIRIKGFKYELLYQGVSDKTLRITYREYINDFARPAFFQEVTYVFNPSGTTTISFKKVEIDILSANNKLITYRVIKGF